MLGALLYALKIGYTTTATVKSGFETAMWTKKWSKKLWKMSAFNRTKHEK